MVTNEITNFSELKAFIEHALPEDTSESKQKNQAIYALHQELSKVGRQYTNSSLALKERAALLGTVLENVKQVREIASKDHKRYAGFFHDESKTATNAFNVALVLENYIKNLDSNKSFKDIKAEQEPKFKKQKFSLRTHRSFDAKIHALIKEIANKSFTTFGRSALSFDKTEQDKKGAYSKQANNLEKILKFLQKFEEAGLAKRDANYESDQFHNLQDHFVEFKNAKEALVKDNNKDGFDKFVVLSKNQVDLLDEVINDVETHMEAEKDNSFKVRP